MNLTVKRRVVRAARAAFAISVSAVALGAPQAAFAQSNAQGYIYGTAPSEGGEVTIKSKDTGFTRSSSVGSNGSFRFESLPIGSYTVTYTLDGEELTDDVVVSLNKGAQVRFQGTESVELGTFQVTGATIAMVDTASSEVSTSFSAAELERIPLQRNLAEIQMLAPDAVRGSNDFSSQQGFDVVSFGGSSPLENAYYLNGFNITDFRKGLGSSEVPFEAVGETSIRTGGYSSEFGRSIGGSISMVTKTGTNQFKAGGNIFYEPDWGREDRPDYYDSSGSPRFINNEDERDVWESNIFASGPIIKDKLFFYGLVGLKHSQIDNLTTGAVYDSKQVSDTPAYWLANLSANLAEGHRVDFTAFSDTKKYTTTRVGYDLAGNVQVPTSVDSVTKEEVGGDNFILNYTGQFTDWFTLSALYGNGERVEIGDSATISGDPCPIITDSRGDSSTSLGCSPAANAVDISDEREAYRLDATFSFDLVGYHQLKVGYDHETLTTDYASAYPGGGLAYLYDTCANAEGCTLNGGFVAEGEDYVRTRSYDFYGKFDNNLDAYYLQDAWQVTPRLLVNLGVRNDIFDLELGNGDSYIKLEDNWAPRLGVAYDTFGDGRSKVYANYGRYFLPIETNTAARALTTGADQRTYYSYSSIDPVTGLPSGLTQIGATSGSVSDGSPPAYDADAEATAQDEYIIGFQMEVAPRWSAGIKGTYRELKAALEDTCYFTETLAYGCVILNPGEQNIEINGQDFDFDGTDDYITLSNDDLLLPDAKRKYYAVELALERAWDGKWFQKFTYTWSHLYGNFEGFSNSDIGQADPGISVTFDNFALVANGDLPNDRRHIIKWFGGYNVTEELQFGAVLQVASGRPENAFGIIPQDTPGFYEGNPALNNAIIDAYNGAYDGSFAYVDGEPVGRASGGRLPWTWTLDLSTSYSPRMVPGLTLGAAVYNVFDNDEVTNIDEAAEFTSGANPLYGSPRYADSYQTPRTIALNARYEFGL